MLGDFFVYVVKDVENNVFLLKMHLLGIQLTVSLTLLLLISMLTIMHQVSS